MDDHLLMLEITIIKKIESSNVCKFLVRGKPLSYKLVTVELYINRSG